jgi:ankyrin repeat protein
LGADVNQRTTAGNTAIHAAAYTASDSILQVLVSVDGNVNARNNGGETPSSMAIGLSPNSMSTYATHEETAALLVRLGAAAFTPDEIEIVKRDGFRALNRR